jgi:hypothetical protein
MKTPKEIAENVLCAAQKRQSERKRGSFANKIDFNWENVWGEKGMAKSLSEEIAQAIQAERDRLEVAVEALRFYGDLLTWDRDRMLCGSENLRTDLEETSYSRFTPGQRARSALAKIKGLV